MIKKLNHLMRLQVQEVVNNFNLAAQMPAPKDGWIKMMRTALGMSSKILANRFGCIQSNIINMEKREAQGTITLETLHQVAQAMNCKLVYGLIPLEPIETIRRKQALKIAAQKIKMSNHSMALEDQALTPKQLEQKESRLVQELLEENSKKLWDDDAI